MNPSAPNRIITLTTDFGSQDYFVAAMKGVILSINPEARIVDLTHEISPQNIQAAAFNLLACYQNFPAGTTHVAVVDPGVGSIRRPVLIECSGHFFIGPDNGIFSWICDREGSYRAVHLTDQKLFRHPVSTTFHGRDIFASVAAVLSRGQAPEEFGEVIDNLVRLEPLAPQVVSARLIMGRIIHIDHFGNCITNLSADVVGDDFNRLKLEIDNHSITSFRRYFSEALENESDIFCVIGSAGFLEIAARNASAASLLKAYPGQSVRLNLQNPA